MLGFGNRWYEEAFSEGSDVELGQNTTLRVIQPVYFVATKLTAFRNPSRVNHDDLLASHDIEDLLTVMIGVPKLVEQIAEGRDKVHDYIRSEFRDLLAHPDFHDLLSSQFVELIQTTAAAEVHERLRAMSGRRLP